MGRYSTGIVERGEAEQVGRRRKIRSCNVRTRQEGRREEEIEGGKGKKKKGHCESSFSWNEELKHSGRFYKRGPVVSSRKSSSGSTWEISGERRLSCVGRTLWKRGDYHLGCDAVVRGDFRRL